MSSVFDILDKVDEKYDKNISYLKEDGSKSLEEIASGNLEIEKINDIYKIDISKERNQQSRFAAAILYHDFKDNPDVFIKAFESSGELKFANYDNINSCFYFMRNNKIDD